MDKELDAAHVARVELRYRPAKNSIHAFQLQAKTQPGARKPLVRSDVCGPRAEANVRDEFSSRRYYVSGTVQGVGFRYFVHRVARELRLNGFVRNLRDGRVEVYAIAPVESLGALRRQLERGPSGSCVSGVTEHEAPIEAQYSQTFSIEDDA